MSRKFQVGDRVRVKRPQSVSHGVETVITAINVRAWHGQYVEGCCRTDILLDNPDPRCSSKYAAFRPEHLVPIYDGNETVSWSSCVWQPKQVRA